MSTRSGKRIHSSFHENTLKPDVQLVAQSERKTRNRRLKENVEELSVREVKSKNRSNYVSYPTTDDEVGIDPANAQEGEEKPTRSLRKNALKELNNVTSSTESSELPTEVPKSVRTTRRTCKFTENIEDLHDKANQIEEVNITQIKPKREKKKKSNPEDAKDVTGKKKLKKKSKKGKRSGSMVVEDIVPEKSDKDALNKSNNVSMESFHSAAGSPVKLTEKVTEKEIYPVKSTEASLQSEDKSESRQTRSAARLSGVALPHTSESVVKISRKRKSSFKDNQAVESHEFDNMLTNDAKKRKSNIRDTISKTNGDITDHEIKNSTFDLEDMEKRKSAVKAVLSSTFDKSDSPFYNDKNTTFEKEQSTMQRTPQSKGKSLDESSKSINDKPTVNTTFDKNDLTIGSAQKSIINTTYEKDLEQVSKGRKSSIINSTYDKDDVSAIISETEDTNIDKSIQKLSTDMNSTYDKTSKSDSTFEKDKNPNATFEKNKKLDTTFDKNSKSSLISSDNSNITLDKSDISRISITSDDSKDNIINTTPVLIESSMDESQINTSKQSLKPDNLNISKQKSPTEILKASPKTTPVTPLNREGTFTKDGSDIPSLPKTPTRKMSLPSPGCTPFPKSGGKPNLLNVTRSIERSRRSSLTEPLPRATRVMFCSPVNNPVVVAQQRRKVIKSNLKGSNKSFVFEEVPEPAARAAPRKRSYTQNDVDEARAKRNRLAERANSLGRPGTRARTSSATGKLPDPLTPSKRTTPKKVDAKISRTKLPNFAALHQREFDKMESLDECQERRARRAKQLLTPTGAVTVLERTSPKDLSDPKPEEAKKSPAIKEDKDQTEPKKPETPIKSLPTLKSLNPGYTRFGFKLNYDVNPFNITSKNDKNFSQSFSSKKNIIKKDYTRPVKEIKGLKRQATLPSMTGATSAREVAKQTVMREKSFTEKRNKIRTENRTVIKGVRTNRRFELQMRMRNVE